MPDKDQGFTLVELLITLSLITIVALVAIPGYDELIASNRHLAIMEQLERAVNNARADAVLKRRTIEICGSSDGKTCSGKWASGWLVRSRDDHPLHFTQLASNTDLRWEGFGRSIRFRDNGSSPTSNGRFYQCHKQKVVWELVLSRQGRLRRGDMTEKGRNEKCGP